MLIIPVLIETMAYLAEEADIEYNAGSNIEEDKSKATDSRIALALSKVREATGEEPDQEEQQEPPKEPMQSGGLMSRRSADGV